MSSIVVAAPGATALAIWTIGLDAVKGGQVLRTGFGWGFDPFTDANQARAVGAPLARVTPAEIRCGMAPQGAVRSRWGRTAGTGARRSSHKARYVYSTKGAPGAYLRRRGLVLLAPGVRTSVVTGGGYGTTRARPAGPSTRRPMQAATGVFCFSSAAMKRPASSVATAMRSPPEVCASHSKSWAPPSTSKSRGLPCSWPSIGCFQATSRAVKFVITTGARFARHGSFSPGSTVARALQKNLSTRRPPGSSPAGDRAATPPGDPPCPSVAL
jgi:hypothetical protein